MVQLSGFNLPSERRVHLVLKAYYDASRDGKGIEAVTLCGVAATQSVWEHFEPTWEAVLDKHMVPDRILRMADLMALEGAFSREKGWDERQRWALLGDLWNVLGAHRDTNLRAYSCTVLLRDWARAKAAIIGKLRSPESMCVNFCVGGLRLPPECAGERKPILLYFDNNEPFMHKVNRVWQRYRRRRGTLFRQIGTIENVDSEYYPVQTADMLAWIVNRKHLGRRDALVNACAACAAIAVDGSEKVYTYDTILEDYPDGTLRPR